MDGHRDTTHFEVINKVQAPPLPHDPTPKNFKVLLVYPNYAMVNLLPTNIGILTACLRRNGFEATARITRHDFGVGNCRLHFQPQAGLQDAVELRPFFDNQRIG